MNTPIEQLTKALTENGIQFEQTEKTIRIDGGMVSNGRFYQGAYDRSKTMEPRSWYIYCSNDSIECFFQVARGVSKKMPTVDFIIETLKAELGK